MSNWMRWLTRRLRALWHSRTLDAEWDAEIRLHLEQETEDLMRTRGLSREEARRVAMASFGGVQRWREAQRDARGFRWVEQIILDLKYAVRSLRKAPLFIFTAVTTIALGIGVATTAFSVVNRLILHPLPFSNEHRTVLLGMQIPGQPAGTWVTSDYIGYWAHLARSFETISLLDPYAGGSMYVGDHTVIASGTGVSPTLFQALGVRPVLGRQFLPEDTVRNAPRVIMLGAAFWRQEFGGRADVIGRTVTIHDTAFTIVGIAPEALIALRDYQDMDFWTPTLPSRLVQLDTTMNGVQAVGVLQKGVSVGRAEQELTLLTTQLDRARGAVSQGSRPAARLMQPSMLMPVSVTRGLWVLLAATLLVLLIACANVASLQLVRSGQRARETAIQAALGASRGRLVRRLLMESLLLALMGGVAGIALARVALGVIVASHPATMPQLVTVQLDGRVLLFATLLIVASTLVFGLVPAAATTRARLARVLRGVSQAVGPTHEGRRAQRLMVAGEVALAVLLLTGTGLAARSLLAMLDINPGFNPEGLLEVQAYPSEQYPDSVGLAQYWNTLRARISAVPGVLTVVPATAGMLQANLGTSGGKVETEAGARLGKPTELTIQERRVPPDYFSVLGIPLLAGRVFNADVGNGRQDGVMVSRSLAARLWPGESAVGQRFHWGVAPHAGPWLTVIGVVSDVGLVGLRGVIPLQLYQYSPANDMGQVSGLFVRMSPGARQATVLSAMRGIFRAVDPHVPVVPPVMETTIVDEAVAVPRFATAMASSLAVLALILAAVGLYGTIAYAVSQRRREFGVRVALVATGGDVLRGVVRSGLMVAMLGTAVGLSAALAGKRVLSGVLYGISPTDPVVFGAVPVGLLIAAGLASYLPARRAARADPVEVLRAE